MSVWYVARVVYQCEYISGFQKPYVLKSYRGDGRRCIHAAVHNLKHLEFQTSLRHSTLPPSEKKTEARRRVKSADYCNLQTQRGQTLQARAGNHLLRKALGTNLAPEWKLGSALHPLLNRRLLTHTHTAHHNKHTRRTPCFHPAELQTGATGGGRAARITTQRSRWRRSVIAEITRDKLWLCFTCVCPVPQQKSPFSVFGIWCRCQTALLRERGAHGA